MARFRNEVTGAVVSVSDDKADRFADGWVTADEADTEEAAPKRSRKKSE